MKVFIIGNRIVEQENSERRFQASLQSDFGWKGRDD